MKMTVLYVGDVVSRAGVYAVKKGLPALRATRRLDFVMAGSNSVTNGMGLGFNHAMYLQKMGINALTLGENAFFHKDLVEGLSRLPMVVRPANYPTIVPGFGWRSYKVDGVSVAVLVLLGQSGFTRVHLDNPFVTFDKAVAVIKAKGISLIFVDFWACTTAEKNTFFHYAKGKVTAVFGSWGRVLTSDAVLREGTATITGSGRTGSFVSVAGLDVATEIERYKMAMFPRSQNVWDSVELQGVLVECERTTGLATNIEMIKLGVEHDASVEIQ